MISPSGGSDEDDDFVLTVTYVCMYVCMYVYAYKCMYVCMLYVRNRDDIPAIKLQNFPQSRSSDSLESKLQTSNKRSCSFYCQGK